MKARIGDFAVFGGAGFRNHAPRRPNVGRRDRLFDRLNDLLDRRWLSAAGSQPLALKRRPLRSGSRDRPGVSNP
jgi:hypothetical protein